MNYRLTCSVFLTLTLTLAASAQGSKPGGGGGAGASSPTRGTGTMPPPASNPSNPGLGQRAFLSGRVMLDDGTQLTESANIQTICRGRRQTVAHTDSHGGFSFELGDRMANMASGISDADVDSVGNSGNGGSAQRDWRNCEVQAELPGYVSQPVDLGSRLTTFESADIGRLVLHRMAHVEGLTISATSAMAPKDAQKAYEKGRAKAAKEKWDEAEAEFNKAVGIYPKYAACWFDLGRVQVRNSQLDQARHSFEQSVAADPKFVSPYRGLAELDAQQKQWQPLVAVTGQLLALDPVSFPDAWFSNAVGNYYLRNLAEAEKSARQGIKVDDQHRVPRLEDLLGVILMQRQDYPEAAVHIQNYLKFATQPTDIEDARKQLAEITRLSATASNTGEPEKK